ncbi:hypothetical protein N5J06_20055 [Ralstonia sp. CHL-2022]|uniref:Glycerophosphoryl diester phosphodiesterase membrane domain-containing protein n=1 Tax=Ralstonia mojiangensis TaxID=2953895 RepID=A0ABT2LDL4_9RALS|nr:hypothetical protein [Ralstonia mojiangensis]MCT7313274.1 hypothetical protein [Ralstonia mojiangensis]
MNVKISKGETIKAAYRSALQVPLSHPLLAVLTTVGLLMVTVVATNGQSRPWFFMTLLMMVQTLVTVPLQVAGYRYLLKGSANDHAWSHQTAVFCLFAVLSGTAFVFILKLRLILGPVASVVQLALYYVYYRLILVLPALATDAGKSSIRLSWDATTGRFWFLFVVMAAGTAPILLATVFMLMSGQVSVLGSPITPIGSMLQAITAIVSTFLVVGTNSAIYQRLLAAAYRTDDAQRMT